MTEKRRGLGRGLGALIPQTVTDDRPVDVFFPSVGEGESSEKAGRQNDPAASMRSARRVSRETAASRGKRGGAAERAASSSTASGNDAPTSGSKRTGGGTQKSKGVSESAPDRKSQADSGSRGKARKPATAAGKGRKVADAKTDPTELSQETQPAHDAQPAQDAQPNKAASEEARTGDEGTQSGLTAGGEAPTTAVDGGAPQALPNDPASLAPVDGTVYGEVPLSEIAVNPHQPRQVFDEEALEELVSSITEVGILQPVVVRLVSDTTPRYQLIMGERRFRASTAAGLATIPAIIRETDDDQLLRDALLENLHRVDLNPLEEAAAYEQLLKDFGCTQEELSSRIGRSRPQISNTLRLLKLPPLVQRRVAAGVISAGHARALLSLDRASDMETLAQRIVAEGLSVRAAEEAAVLLNAGELERPRGGRGSRPGNPELDALAASIGDRLDTKVSIAMGRRKGKISVEFAGEEDLGRILEALRLK